MEDHGICHSQTHWILTSLGYNSGIRLMKLSQGANYPQIRHKLFGEIAKPRTNRRTEE